MKKFLSIIGCIMLFLMLFACGNKTAEVKTDSNKLTIEDGKIRVAMECSYAPYNWTQPNENNGAVPISGSGDFAYGYDVMIAKKVAEKLGLTLEIVKLDWDSLVPAVQSGTVDLVIAGQSITSDRLQSVDFSNPYYYASIVVLTKKDSKYANAKKLDDLSLATATSQINTIWYDKCLDQIPNVNKLPAQESAPQMLVTLESNICDVVVTDMPTAKGACVAYDDLTILDLSEGDFVVSDEDINIGISMKKGNSVLKDKVNEVLATMNKDDYNTMMDEAINIQPLNQ